MGSWQENQLKRIIVSMQLSHCPSVSCCLNYITSTVKHTRRSQFTAVRAILKPGETRNILFLQIIKLI